jgi:hypothetical protein
MAKAEPKKRQQIESSVCRICHELFFFDALKGPTPPTCGLNECWIFDNWTDEQWLSHCRMVDARVAAGYQIHTRWYYEETQSDDPDEQLKEEFLCRRGPLILSSVDKEALRRRDLIAGSSLPSS